MNKKKKLIIGFSVFIILILGIFVYFQLKKNFQGALVLIKPPSLNVEDLTKKQAKSLPLNLPDEFEISIFAQNLPGIRVIVKDFNGNFWVSQTKEGKVSLIEVKDNKAINIQPIFQNLNNPHGLAFDPEDPYILYIAEEDKISKVRVYSDESVLEKIIDLPKGGRHFTRTISFGPDNRLYVSIGSSCNVCFEKDEKRAAIYSMNKDGGDFQKFAWGLRNAVFFTWNFVDGKMWATEMGRDYLGDDLPPDEINIIEKGKNYGWPICYGKNIHDTDFDKNIYFRNPCMEPFEIPSYIDIPAHSAPLGLAFFPEEGWPEKYWHDLLVAYHGSWNRSTPTGYKIVRIPLDEKGNLEGEIQDFITGWLTDKGVWGRPVDVFIDYNKTIYITDDRAGVVYRVSYKDK